MHSNAKAALCTVLEDRAYFMLLCVFLHVFCFVPFGGVGKVSNGMEKGREKIPFRSLRISLLIFFCVSSLQRASNTRSRRGGERGLGIMDMK